MAIIDPDGLFHGDRLRRCSDAARLAWPHLFLLANGFGRIEINYDRIAAAVFAGYKDPPSEQAVYGWVQEYRDAHLLFLYEARGQLWGQWDCKPGCLPRWKSRKDQDSPAPPQAAYDAWLRAYRNESKPLPKTSEILESLKKNCGKLPHGIGDGVGVGVGGGVGFEEVRKPPLSEEEPPPAPQTGAGFSLIPPESFKPSNGWKQNSFEKFWAIVWWKTGKDDARRKWDQKIKSQAMAEFVIKAALEQGPELLAAAEREQRSAIHPATWLHKGRWADQPVPIVGAAKRTAREQSNIDAVNLYLGSKR